MARERDISFSSILLLVFLVNAYGKKGTPNATTSTSTTTTNIAIISATNRMIRKAAEAWTIQMTITNTRSTITSTPTGSTMVTSTTASTPLTTTTTTTTNPIVATTAITLATARRTGAATWSTTATTSTTTLSTTNTSTPTRAVASSEFRGIAGVGWAGGGVCIFGLLGIWLRILYKRSRKKAREQVRSDKFKPTFADDPMATAAECITPRSWNGSQATTAPTAPRTPKTPGVQPRKSKFSGASNDVDAMMKAFQKMTNEDHMIIDVLDNIKPLALGHRSAPARFSNVIDIDDVGVDMDIEFAETPTFGDSHCGSRSVVEWLCVEDSQPMDCNGCSVTDLASMQRELFRDWWVNIGDSCNVVDDVCDEGVAHVRSFFPVDRVEPELEDPPDSQLPRDDEELVRDGCCSNPMLQQSFRSELSGGFNVPAFSTEYSFVTTETDKTVGAIGMMINDESLVTTETEKTVNDGSLVTTETEKTVGAIGMMINDEASSVSTLGTSIMDDDVDGAICDGTHDTMAVAEVPGVVNRAK